MPRCPHCHQAVNEHDLLDDDPIEMAAQRLRRYSEAYGFQLNEEEAVRKALGHRLEIELQPIPTIWSNGIYFASVSPWKGEAALWREAFDHLCELGEGALGVCLL